MDRNTGGSLDYLDHLRQSIVDILSTPIGTRVHRRDYGSQLPRLVDRPINSSLIADLIAATADALAKWEPRIRLERVTIESVDPSGKIVMALRAILLIDGTPIEFDGLVIR
jgi:phage baseplate assembly protein W